MLKLQKLGEQTFGRLEKVNSELFTLTYGSFVLQLLKDFEDVKEVNKQLEKLGFKMGQRLIDEYFSKSGANKCQDFKDSAEHISKVGFRMFLGVSAKVAGYMKNEDGDLVAFDIRFEDNPLIDFVELPNDKLKNELIYCNILCGVIRGCMDMVNYRVECKYTKCPLNNEKFEYSEIRVTLKEVLKEQAKIDD